MAKSARSSKVKSNNSKLKSKVFGPIENARTERLSAKLLELASLPRPSASKKDSEDTRMEVDIAAGQDVNSQFMRNNQDDEMEVDQVVDKPSPKAKTNRGRIQKKRSSRYKASVVFPRYKTKTKTKTKTKRQSS